MSDRTFWLNAWEPDQDPVIGSLLSIDTETELFVAQEFPAVVMLQVTAGDRVDLVTWQDIPVYMEKLLKYNPESQIVFVNAAYDLGVLGMDELYDLVDERRIIDMMDRYKLWDISERGYVRQPASLKGMARNVLNVDLPKDDELRLNFTRAKDPTFNQLIYGSYDVMATWLLGDRIPPMPTEADSQIMGSIVLDGISRNGMLVDRGIFDALLASHTTKLHRDLAELEMQGYCPLLSGTSSDVIRAAIDYIGIERDLPLMTAPKMEYLLVQSMMASYMPLDEFRTAVNRAITNIEREECPYFTVEDMVRHTIEEMAHDMPGKLKRDKVTAAEEHANNMQLAALCEPAAKARINPFKAGKWRKRLNEIARGYLASQYVVSDGRRSKTTKEGLGLDDFATAKTLSVWPLAFVIRELFMTKAGSNPLIEGEFDLATFATHMQIKALRYANLGNDWSDCLKSEAFMQDRLKSIEMKNGVTFPRTDGGKDKDPKKVKIQVSKKDMWIFKKYKIEDKLIELFIEYKHNEKLISTYLNPAHIWPDGRVHTRYENYVRTGRTSSSKPNVQNVPGSGGLRDMYIPAPGCIYASIDYSQLELCSLAQHCYRMYGFSRMLELINAKIDLHSWFAAKTMGLLTEENDYDGTTESRDRVVEILKDVPTKQRKNAKAANFGFPGGMSAKTFLRTQRGYGNIEITLEECEELRTKWFEAFPEMVHHMSPESDVVNDYDRKRLNDPNLRLSKARNIMGVLRRKCTFNSACNFPFQSLAAIGAKRALWKVWRDPRYRHRIVNFIHDELLLELPAETAADDVAIISALMVEAMREILPDVRIEAEGCLMERWDKDAEPVYDDFGNLTVWRPEEAAA